MSSVVLDASSLLTLINEESGHEAIQQVLSDAVMSSVSLAEVASVLIAKHKVSKEEVNQIISELVKGIITFNDEQAYIVGELEKLNVDEGYKLSLGERSSLALGIVLNIPVYTTNNALNEIKWPGLSVTVVK